MEQKYTSIVSTTPMTTFERLAIVFEAVQFLVRSLSLQSHSLTLLVCASKLSAHDTWD
jgi:hypothetical protein